MMVVRLPLHNKMSLARLYEILNKFQQWFSAYDPKVEIDGRYLVIHFNIKEK